MEQLDYEKPPHDPSPTSELRWLLAFAAILTAGVVFWALARYLDLPLGRPAGLCFVVGGLGVLWWGSAMLDKTWKKR